MIARIVLILLAALLAGAAIGFMLHPSFDPLDFVQSRLATLQSVYDSYPLLTLLGFSLLFTLLVASMVPGSLPLMLLAGALFGTAAGTVICVLAGTLGATLLFLLTRHVFTARLMARYGERLRPVNAQIERYGGFYLLVLRLAPGIPTNLIALLMGLTSLRPPIFFWVTLIGIAPWYYIYVSAGERLTQMESLSDIVSVDMLALFGAAAALLLMGLWLKWRFTSPSERPAAQ